MDDDSPSSEPTRKGRQSMPNNPPSSCFSIREDELTLNTLAEQLAERLSGKLVVPAFLTIQAAAAFIGLSADSIRSLLSSGRLRAYRPVRGRILISKEELETLVLASTGQPRHGRGIRKSRKKVANVSGQDMSAWDCREAGDEL
jgi:excisionase family DNA binding protein